MRWIHIYLSMAGFAAIVLFSVTGVTLNHPTWFGAELSSSSDHSGTVRREWLDGPKNESGETTVDRLAIAEFLRAEHRLSGAVTDFRSDDAECSLTWKGPGYAADAIIDRESGKYSLTVTTHGLVSILNDLHKGRDSGPAWSVLIDVTAILTTISALTGLVLLVLLRRKRLNGLLAALGGTLVVAAVYGWLVP